MDRIEKLILSMEKCLIGIEGRRCDCREVLEEFQSAIFRAAILAAAQTICGCDGCNEGVGDRPYCEAGDLLDILNDPECLENFLAQALPNPDPKKET